MIEIEFVGLGGQGSVVAAKLLADAGVKAGFNSQAFAAYGARRRGGEVESYIRLGEGPILNHSKIYGADYVIIMDENLVEDTHKKGKFKNGATVVINTSKPPAAFSELTDCKVTTLDANRIAVNKGVTLPSGMPVINTTILGALWGLLPSVTLDQLIESLRDGKLPAIERNLEAAREAYAIIQRKLDPSDAAEVEVAETGPVVIDRLPEYRPKLAPCEVACPAGERINEAAFYIQYGQFEDALQSIKEENPFPGICGRVCFHPCETECNRVKYDEGIATNALERAAFDNADSGKVERPETKPATGKTAAITGSGPAGMTCARYLALLGHKVTVFEAQPVAGGVPRFGIPEYHLPRDIVDREIAEIGDLGVEIKLNTRVGKDITFDAITKDYDACFVATGAHRSMKLGIPGEDNDGTYSGLDFLKRVALGEKISLGKKVVVIGGGNVAMDVARTAARMGGTEIQTVCLESREEMPAYSWEVAAAEAEGIGVQTGWGPSQVIASGGKVSAVEFHKCTSVFDSQGKFSPAYDKSDSMSIDCDTVITAIGERLELPFPDGTLAMSGPVIQADKLGKTSMAGVYAGGDAASLSRSIVEAIASGKRAALGIDLYLTNTDEGVADSFLKADKGAIAMGRYLSADSNGEGSKVVGYEDLNLAHFTEAPRIVAAELAAKTRTKDFSETNLGFSKESAMAEAERCFHCGSCTLCEICYISCPDIAISFESGSPIFNSKKEVCKSCGICIYECPRSAISWKGVA
ncbi:MAG: 2-oxoacid:acceptor oxidoreductase family protein [Dehalococcoidales bacterium]|jgi:2-oxoacid:acceptor oxidoreductase gamma subunit (pyruvate/2-ketoisovalerate family)|nr:2-oxoacid:acceptor oxidoreductase family protein [Dehalococcoidales bacterium]